MAVCKVNIVQLHLWVPQSDEQPAIANILDYMNSEILALEQKKRKAQAIKSDMMSKPLTDRIRLL